MKGRFPRGEAKSTQNLKEATVAEILRAHANGTPPKALAAQFNLSGSTVTHIVRRTTWKHVLAA